LYFLGSSKPTLRTKLMAVGEVWKMLTVEVLGNAPRGLRTAAAVGEVRLSERF